MKRRLINAAALISLVLCLVFSALWLRSHWRDDLWTLAGDGKGADVVSTGGVLRIELWNNVNTASEPLELRWLDPHEVGLGVEWRETRWQWSDWSNNERSETWIQFPHWLLVLISIVGPLLRSWGLVAQPTGRMHECPSCRYDLRGTPGSECPECGVASGKREAKA